MEPPRLFIYVMEQDDPRKCTAALLTRKSLATAIRRISEIRANAIVLNPAAPQFLLHSDRADCIRSGVVAIDCSWEKAAQIFMTRFRGANRKLPGLLAANPVNYARIGRLSTAEALAAALWITGFRERAEALLSILSWGRTFVDLNGQLLTAYTQARSEKDIVRVQTDFGLENPATYP